MTKWYKTVKYDQIASLKLGEVLRTGVNVQIDCPTSQNIQNELNITTSTSGGTVKLFQDRVMIFVSKIT